MNYFLFFGGLFMLIFACIIPMPKAWEQYEVLHHGEQTYADIIKISKPYWHRRYSYRRRLVLGVHGHEVTKEVHVAFSDSLKPGDRILVLTMPGKDQIMLPRDDPDGHQFYAGLLLGVAGIYFMFRGARDRKN
jgi:hypothetical protein